MSDRKNVLDNLDKKLDNLEKVNDLFGGKATETKIIDIGEEVCCDICNEDFTNSDEEGGFLFGSKAYCPKCAEKRLPAIKSYNEEHYIKAYCPKGMSFRQFVLNLRGGDNTIKIITQKKGK